MVTRMLVSREAADSLSWHHDVRRGRANDRGRSVVMERPQLAAAAPLDTANVQLALTSHKLEILSQGLLRIRPRLRFNSYVKGP